MVKLPFWSVNILSIPPLWLEWWTKFVLALSVKGKLVEQGSSVCRPVLETNSFNFNMYNFLLLLIAHVTLQSSRCKIQCNDYKGSLTYSLGYVSHTPRNSPVYENKYTKEFQNSRINYYKSLSHREEACSISRLSWKLRNFLLWKNVICSKTFGLLKPERNYPWIPS